MNMATLSLPPPSVIHDNLGAERLLYTARLVSPCMMQPPHDAIVCVPPMTPADAVRFALDNHHKECGCTETAALDARYRRVPDSPEARR